MRPTAVRDALPVVAAILLALGLALGATGGAVAAQQAETGSDAATTMRIELRPNGDAEWSVTMRFALDSPNETRAFDRLATEFAEGEAGVLPVAPFERAAARASNATGRPMAIRNVSRTSDRANRTGTLVLSFTWTNFTRVSGDRIRLGDVFRTESGTWLPGLSADQELIIEFPEGYTITSSSRPLRNRTFHVTGPASFEPGDPSAQLERAGQTASPTGPGGLGQAAPALGVGAIAALIGGIAYLLHRRRDEEPPGDVAATPVDGGDGDGAQEPDGEPVPEPEPDEELLADEERVLRLLRRNGGRMKQVDIVDETDWSNAKVSQLLSEMDEAGQIDKLRIGRENLISLPGEGFDRGEG